MESVENPRPDASVEASSCDSCGDEGVGLTLVQRLYVVADSGFGDEVAAEPEVRPGDLEWWCVVCQTHYPHQTQPDAAT